MIVEKLKTLLPNWLKPVLRFFYYSAERRRVWREIGIKKIQNKLIQQQYLDETKKLIVFIVVGADWVTGKDKISGGAISIVSLCQETQKLKKIHGAEVIMCTWKGEQLFLRHTTFENNTNVFRFEQVITYFNNLKELMIHIPELLVEQVLTTINFKDQIFLKNINDVRINIMNQNIRLMPDPSAIKNLLEITPNVSITTAHQRYCTAEYRSLYNVPIHKFSVWISPEQYTSRTWRDKKNLIVVSPDEHPLKQEILAKIEKETNLEVFIIQNLKYEQYKTLISEAKWSLTFGEGLDGYFIEPIFSGAISFAIFNEQFFTESFRELKTVYSDQYDLLNSIVEDVNSLDNQIDFDQYQEVEFKLCSALYSFDEYKKNLMKFYQHEYTFP
jgi:hypothetical protein